MSEERIIKKVPGNLKLNPKENQGYIEELSSKTKVELLESNLNLQKTNINDKIEWNQRNVNDASDSKSKYCSATRDIMSNSVLPQERKSALNIEQNQPDYCQKKTSNHCKEPSISVLTKSASLIQSVQRIDKADNNKLSVCRQKRRIPPRRSISKKQKPETIRRYISYLFKRLPELAKYFELHGIVGQGAFSSVFLGTLKPEIATQFPELESEKFAIKHLIPPINPMHIARELKLLHQIGGKDNVVGVNFSMREGGCCVIVMPYLSHRKFGDYFLRMDVEETRDYIRNLMIALKRVHSFNVIHRDVKPNNFLYNRESRRYLLVDFGLSHSVCPQAKWIVNERNDKKRKRQEDGSSEVLQKKNSIGKKLFSSNNENELPQSCGTPAKAPFDTSLTNFLSSISRKEALPSKTHASTFMTLVPKPVKDSCSVGSTLVHVENSQVQAQVLKSMSPLESDNETQTKLLFKEQEMKRNSFKCFCKRKGPVYDICLQQPTVPVRRGGTPGFKPPEVLLQSQIQTTAVDMWAAGIILVSILSGRYPFFRRRDDVLALVEMMTVFGSDKVESVAKTLGRGLSFSGYKPARDLRKLCEVLRSRRKDFKAGLMKQRFNGCLCPDSEYVLTGEFPASAYDLLLKLLDLDPATRITAEEALEHPFLKGE